MAIEMDLKTMQGNSGLQDCEICDDTAETLSLTDLPLNSFASDLDEFSREERSVDHDLFEFFSEDFTASTCNGSRDAIFFCGKLIPHKGAEVAVAAHDRKLTSIPGNRKGGSYFLKKLRKSTDKHDHLGSTKKISILASPIKPRWYLFTVGVGKLPKEMKLSDMRMRQSRRNPSNKFQHDNRCEFVKRGRSNKAKSLWGLLKVWVARVNKLVL